MGSIINVKRSSFLPYAWRRTFTLETESKDKTASAEKQQDVLALLFFRFQKLYNVSRRDPARRSEPARIIASESDRFRRSRLESYQS